MSWPPGPLENLIPNYSPTFGSHFSPRRSASYSHTPAPPGLQIGHLLVCRVIPSVPHLHYSLFQLRAVRGSELDSSVPLSSMMYVIVLLSSSMPVRFPLPVKYVTMLYPPPTHTAFSMQLVLSESGLNK